MTARLGPNKPTRRREPTPHDAAGVADLSPEFRRAYWDRLARDITLAVCGDKLGD